MCLIFGIVSMPSGLFGYGRLPGRRTASRRVSARDVRSSATRGCSAAAAPSAAMPPRNCRRSTMSGGPSAVEHVVALEPVRRLLRDVPVELGDVDRIERGPGCDWLCDRDDRHVDAGVDELQLEAQRE